ncbi:MAG: transposase, partial [Acetobacteraceae bacterium]|nr:transposase [Acetobacteraceae bacterium]
MRRRHNGTEPPADESTIQGTPVASSRKMAARKCLIPLRTQVCSLRKTDSSRTCRSWKKLHLATDADTGRIVAAAPTDKDADDGSQLGPLLDQAGGPVASVTADGTFDRDDVHAEVAARHPDAPVIVPPRSGAVPSDAAETA